MDKKLNEIHEKFDPHEINNHTVQYHMAVQVLTTQ